MNTKETVIVEAQLCENCEGKGHVVNKLQRDRYNAAWETFYGKYGEDALPPKGHDLWILPNGFEVCFVCEGTGRVLVEKYISGTPNGGVLISEAGKS